MVEAVIEQFFQVPLDAEKQSELVSSKMTARFLHSWPTEESMGKEVFIKYQKEIQEGCPDWNYRAKLWKQKTVEGQPMPKTVYLVINVCCTHTQQMRLLDDVFEPSDPPTSIIMPYELIQIGFNTAVSPPLIESYESRKVFKKIANDSEAKILLDLIKSQKEEIQQYMDYLNAIRNYC